MGLLNVTGVAPLLLPQDDGLLKSDQRLTTAVMTPRLQATLEPDGALAVALWGGGDLAKIKLRLDWQGPYTYGPNYVAAGQAGFYAAQSAPVLLLRRARLSRVTPAAKPARWATEKNKAIRAHEDDRHIYILPWGHLHITQRGDDLLIAGGSDAAECASALKISIDKILQEAKDYAAGCDRLPGATPLLRSMVTQGVHTAMASRRYLNQGRFAGLAAGMAYTMPSRTYYRDGHWTLQALLHTDPGIVPQQLALLARGIHDDGEAPSGVIAADPAQLYAWHDFRAAHPHETLAHQGALDWWSDHTDSPLYFILSLGDYCTTAGDSSLFKTYLPQIRAIFHRYQRLAVEGSGLPRKPRHDRDWADNVFRVGDVSYIVGLWLAALRVIQRFGPQQGAVDLAAQAADAYTAALPHLARLNTTNGWPCNYQDTAQGMSEDNLSLDILTLSLADVPDSQQILTHIQQTLETRHNTQQPWGDWGMMCAWPPYRHRRDLRGKTTFAYRYHNGSDWPWLDGLYAREMLRRGMNGWQYPLLRWWEYGLAQGWTSPVEYYSPRFGRGSLLQGWSSLPAAAALSYADIVCKK